MKISELVKKKRLKFRYCFLMIKNYFGQTALHSSFTTATLNTFVYTRTANFIWLSAGCSIIVSGSRPSVSSV